MKTQLDDILGVETLDIQAAKQHYNEKNREIAVLYAVDLTVFRMHVHELLKKEVQTASRLFELPLIYFALICFLLDTASCAVLSLLHFQDIRRTCIHGR